MLLYHNSKVDSSCSSQTCLAAESSDSFRNLKAKKTKYLPSVSSTSRDTASLLVSATRSTPSSPATSSPARKVSAPINHLHDRPIFESCSYHQYSFNRGEHTASFGLHETVVAVSAPREEVNTLRLEVDRLVRGTDAQSSDVNHKHLLEMIKDLKEEFDVDRVRRLGNDNRVSLDHMTKPKVDSVQQLCGELSAKDDKTVLSVLDAVANILTTAETDKVAIMVEECGGLDRIEKLPFS